MRAIHMEIRWYVAWMSIWYQTVGLVTRVITLKAREGFLDKMLSYKTVYNKRENDLKIKFPKAVLSQCHGMAEVAEFRKVLIE